MLSARFNVCSDERDPSSAGIDVKLFSVRSNVFNEEREPISGEIDVNLL